MQFRGAWRDYQSRVLEEMASHLANGRLHVVAAPGAGKTVLGLEIVRRLGRRALVFAPTVAIRDQWAHRLTQLFLETPPGPDDISFELGELRQLTLVTYQALDALRRSDDLDRLARDLDAGGPMTLVLDEAHHLRREWWNGIERLVASLADARVVALTATPPHDAGAAEWARYETLCGPIDLEIGIPELVRNGDLCPHQDHVILSAPTRDALDLLDARRRAMSELQRDLRADSALLDHLEAHPWLQRPQEHVEAILDAPEMLSSVLVMLAAAGRKPPAATLRLLGVSARRIPRPSFFWLEVFLDGVTSRHEATFALGAARLKPLRERLHCHGLIEGGRVRLRETRSIFQMMSSSLAKLDSIAAIATAEDRSLGAALRMVILSDHIRAGDIPADAKAPFRPAKAGVAPIFEHLRRTGVATDHLGVLTSTLVILPRGSLSALVTLAQAQGMAPAMIRTSDIAACPGHLRVELAGVASSRMVPLVTALLERGDLRILVGTQSLLGEGWDAPALNSLILASNTASFVLSNQMRGRAIRVQPGNPGKVANIWHLATVEPPSRDLLGKAADALNWGALMDEGAAGLSDLALLSRRFRAFEGIGNDDASTLIESGVGRLGLDMVGDVGVINARTFALAAERSATARRWTTSLGAGGPRARVRETAAPNYAPRVLAWADTLHALGWAALSAGAFAAFNQVGALDGMQELAGVGMVLAGAAGLAALPDLAKAGRLIWRNGSVEGSLRQVGEVVLRTMVQAGLATETDRENGRFEVRSSLDGRKDIFLTGVSRSVERQVMAAIAEILGPVQNPRHLLVRRSRLGWRMRADYHAVPAAFAARKAYAEIFARLWRQRVGPSELVFTRTPEGRRLLLRARVKSLAAGFQRSVDRRSAWL